MEKQRRFSSRSLRFETLETRQLLAGINLYHNALQPLDVNNDSYVAPIDAMIIINQLNGPAVDLDVEGDLPPGFTGFVDVDNDMVLSPADALNVINGLNLNAPVVNQSITITASDVKALLDRASAASSTSADAIIAIVDRGGAILGVRVGNNINMDNPTEVFAIDGAVAKARAAAFFANQGAPLTSRTVRMISQSTITQREVEANPNITDPNSIVRGPGTVAPIGTGAHFPPGVMFTPTVDLFDIEHTNRDSILHPGVNGIRDATDELLPYRFNIDPTQVPAGNEIYAPESYGFQSGRLPLAQSRGIATLPGGIPLYKNGMLTGGIGVFFPGPDGYATHEQGFTDFYGNNDQTGPVSPTASRTEVLQAAVDRTNAPKVREAEWIAFAATGGSSTAGESVPALNGIAPVTGFDLPFGRIDLVGITLEVIGPNPTANDTKAGLTQITDLGSQLSLGNPANGVDHIIGSDNTGTSILYAGGTQVPDQWLVMPQAGKLHALTDENGDPILDAIGNQVTAQITQQDVETIINNSITRANEVRAGIRLLADGTPGARTRMVFAIADYDGEILGLYRMPDATYFSIAVAVAKARNMAYYNSAAEVNPVDLCDTNQLGKAHTNRTFRFLADPRYPDGIDFADAGCFSILNDPGIDPITAENISGPTPASDFQSVLGFTRFNPERNFHRQSDATTSLNENGVVFFPGAAPLYKSAALIGGLGVSGDGVDQDDVVAAAGAIGFEPPTGLTVDNIQIDGVSLPYQKFLRNPLG
ncbi:MAG: heme-binding protein [Pirellulaceae bacterium]|nr:heme-binding protein [Pirellulaceae bacterium]